MLWSRTMPYRCKIDDPDGLNLLTVKLTLIILLSKNCADDYLGAKNLLYRVSQYRRPFFMYVL